ncbi:DUF983 domain-containing protein [Candidatus Endowatersipora endosymbiont of Watersipora subatra]|uniref:DUF983 domain-containing protein n=1 Tax=Candidatus Endowatersipora endosymbiont of Watersipora subatra TaxID=3077946 RepID=UPI00312C976C
MNIFNDLRFSLLGYLSAGVKCRCPRCGKGNLYEGFLKLNRSCLICSLSFEKRDVGDGPTVFIMMGLGCFVLGSALFVELHYFPPMWIHILLWLPLIFSTGIPAIRIVKGILITLQYNYDASEGHIEEDH